jgi:CheY-like chemotaxis protein
MNPMVDQEILLIEDNPADIRLMKEMMKDITAFNYPLTIAETLKEGCERIKNTNIILILLDLNLPDSTGKQTFNTVKAFAKNIPVVLLTGLQDMELSLALIKDGAQDYIAKQDLNVNLLSKTIQYGIERNKQLKEIKDISDKLEQTNVELNINILQRELSEESLQKSERLLLQQNNDKNLFISILSHDLISHFHNLLWLSEILAEDIRKLHMIRHPRLPQTKPRLFHKSILNL